MKGLVAAVISVVLCVCLVVGLAVRVMAVPLPGTVGDWHAACRAEPDGSAEDRCLGFARAAVNKWQLGERVARLVDGPPLRLCARRAAAMDDAELRRTFATWAEREVRRGGGRTMADIGAVSFLQDEVGCE